LSYAQATNRKKELGKLSEKKNEPIGEKKVSRRSMLKWTGGLAGAAIVGAIAEYGASELMKPVPPPPTPPPSFKPPLSQEVKDRVDQIVNDLIGMHTDEQVQYTTCDANGCRGGPCSVRVRIKNGIVTAIENGDPTNQNMPVEDVYAGEDALKKFMIQSRPCTRAYMWPTTIYHPDRLLYPMKRVGEIGERKFVRISWEEALDTATNKLKELKEKYGPMFIFSPPRIGSYDGFGFSNWGYTSNSSHTLADLLMFGEIGAYKGAAGAFTTVLNCFDTKTFVALGWNPLISNYGGTSNEWTYLMKYFAEKGARIILIDPVYSLSCETIANQWIPIRAGTDLAMLLAMANVLFKEDLYDKAYVSKYVEPTGFAKWKDYVLGNTPGQDGAIDRTPEWAEKICGVPAETIRELTRFCAKSENKPLFFMTYWSVGKKISGEMTGMADECVKAMLGAIGLPGCNSSGVREVNYGPVRYLTGVPVDWKRAKPSWTNRQLVYLRQRYPAYEMYPQVLKGEITEDRYRREIGCAKDWPLPRPVMGWWGTLYGDMNTNQCIRAIRASEFTVSQQWMTTSPNAFYADILLPLADTSFEDYRGFGNAPNMIQLGRKSVEPPGEAKTATWIQMQVEKRYGILDKTEPLLKDVLDDPKKMDEKIEAVYKGAYETYIARDDIKPLNPPSWDQFTKTPVFRVPHVGTTYKEPTGQPYNTYRPFLEDPEKNPLKTPSGKIEFCPAFLADPDMGAKEYIRPRDNFSTEICFGGASPPVIPPMAQWVPGWDGPLTTQGEKYPLEVVSIHTNYHQHHSQDNNPYRREQARQACWLSVADAKVRGIKDGDLVRVYSLFGEIIMPAYVTPRMVPGTANVPYGGWYEPSSTKSGLMPYGIDRRGQQNVLTPYMTYPSTAGVGIVMHTCQVEKFDAA
jgi:anaerobic dimethyl sulfoxide reductase subunit A